MTSYSQAAPTSDFAIEGGYVNGYTVELILQTDGNMASRDIDASEF